MKRAAGVLLPIFSLPSPHGIGCFSKEAYQFVDFLAKAGQKYWQILPLGPTSYGDSPYQSYSTYAGNPYFIDLDELVKEKLLKKAEVDAYDLGDGEKIDYGKLYNNRIPLLKTAYERSLETEDPEFEKFKAEQAWWLKDYCMFRAIKEIFNDRWDNWAEDIRYRWGYAMEYYSTTYAKEIGFHEWMQYKFLQQWKKLKAYANEKGIKIVGDIPIYVAYDSPDVWAHPELFQLDEKRQPAAVAGCPPDGFSADGQVWGNPLYRWDYHKDTGFDWWSGRIWYCFQLYDVVRIDHFRAFDEYFSIPAADKNAKNGHWEKGPGMDFFNTLKWRLGEKDIIAEDLGYMTDGVRKLVKDSGYPGMKVIQFAFDVTDTNAKGDYLPHNYTPNSVVYTGTHDNETIYGWVKGITKAEKKMVREYLNRPDMNDEELARELVRTAHAAVSDLCVIPMQDYLLLDNSARVNFPSSMGTNWQWRMKKADLTAALAKEIKTLTQRYGRLTEDAAAKKKANAADKAEESNG